MIIRSWRIADVADAFAPTTGTYLMNVYSVFKEQAAAFHWLCLNCTFFRFFLLRRRTPGLPVVSLRVYSSFTNLVRNSIKNRSFFLIISLITNSSAGCFPRIR